MSIEPSKINRLALCLMRSKGISHTEAVAELKRLTLSLGCTAEIKNSAALQAALLTAINTGKRAFLGGLRVELPNNIPLKLRWPGSLTLNQVVTELTAGLPLPSGQSTSQTLHFGIPNGEIPRKSLSIDCSGWRGGVQPARDIVHFENDDVPDFALGGVFAGGLAVHHAFIQVTGINSSACDTPKGISLWNPEENWLNISSEGPRLRALPSQLWCLGLGHLGQAYLWSLGLLPYEKPSEVLFLLNDFDRIEDANWGSGMLTECGDLNVLKTRVCLKWLQARGFDTLLCERRFDNRTYRHETEPAIALCGFDKAEPRRSLEEAGFDQVLECALGAGLSDFDCIHIHNFPNSRAKAKDLWGTERSINIDRKLLEAFAQDQICGALAIDAASKAVSTSFVGAMAGAMVIAEVLRRYNKGLRFDEVLLNARNLKLCQSTASQALNDPTSAARLGFASAL